MRKDMKKVVVETGRSGGGWNKGSRRNWRKGLQGEVEDYDGGPIHIPMLVKPYDRKSQGDKLNPLVSFLQNRIGRKWDEVFSEICKVNDIRSLLGFHLHTHLRQYVEVKGFPKQGYRNWYRFGRNNFYVDGNGILRRYPYRSYRAEWRKEKAKVEIIELEDDWRYQLRDGFWYREKNESILGKIPAVLDQDGKEIRPERIGVVETIYWKFQCGQKELREIREILAWKKPCKKRKMPGARIVKSGYPSKMKNISTMR